MTANVTSVNNGLNIGGTGGVNPSDFKIFSILAITVISVFSSIIISIIEKGTMRGGMKYIPMFLITSLTIYFIASGLLSFVFGSIKFGG